MRSPAEDSLDPEVVRSNRRKLLLMFAIPFAVLFGAYLMFYTGVGIPTGTTNKGELITPAIQTDELVYSILRDEAGPHEAKWQMLIPVSLPCTQQCLDTLYITRQVHLRLAKKDDMIARRVVLTEQPSAAFMALLEDQHRFATVSTVDQAAWDEINQSIGAQQGDYFLVDPRGWLMMGYREAHTGEDLLTDLKRLLR